VEVMGIADEVLLVLMPGSGDSVQALKAGIMEIPDVIAINKSDTEGAKALLNDIRNVLSLDAASAHRPPIVLTEATRAEGIEPLWDALVSCRETLAASGRLEERRRRNLTDEVLAAATVRARSEIEKAVEGEPGLEGLIEAVQRREIDPRTAAERIASTVLRERSA